MTTSNDIVNEALLLFGNDGPPVTGVAPLFDSSAAGKAASRIYQSCVAAVAREYEWDFSRQQGVNLTLSGNVAPFPWAYEYVYPPQCIQLWQLAPAVLADPNDPQPLRWSVGNNVVGGTQSRVIWSNVQNAKAAFNGNPAEGTWDSLFRAAVVRVLASELSMALAGKPDSSQTLLEHAGAFQNIGVERDS
jgi:hypothetical protein